MKILVINCGSSSIKYKLYEMDSRQTLAAGGIEKIGLPGAFLKIKMNDGSSKVIEAEIPDHSVGIKMMFDALLNKEYGAISSLDEIGAAGHRIVHGGVFTKSQVVTDQMIEEWKQYMDLAPLHSYAHLKGYNAVKQLLPELKQVFVFDTAFHQTMPDYAYMYALPYQYYTEDHIRRYGAHGTSHRYVTQRSAEVFGQLPKRLITCHIGNGSSISAVKGGKCIDTTMGFTPLDGLEMGTRCGSIDPAIVTYIMKKEGFTPDEMSEFMNKKCGFLGISGYSSDSRDIEKGILEGNHRAYLAASILAYQVKKYIGAFTAAMDGLDAIVFTAGMGENNPELRERVCKDMTYFGIEIDTELNAKMFRQPNTVKLSTENSKVLVYLLPTNEELMIASDTEEIVKKLKK